MLSIAYHWQSIITSTWESISNNCTGLAMQCISSFPMKGDHLTPNKQYMLQHWL